MKERIERLSAVSCLLLAALIMAGCRTRSVASKTGTSGLTWKGVVYACWSRDAYAAPVAEASLNRLRATGANSVAIVTTWYMDTATSTVIAPDARKTPSDAAFLTAVRAIQRRGLRVVVKPHVDVRDGTWRGAIEPADPKAWFRSYSGFIDHYARIAQANRVDMLIIGTELQTVSGPAYRSQWTELIEGVHRVYSGPLVYAANWDEYREVSFWPMLDFLGVDAYFPLARSRSPSLPELIRGWSDGGHNWVAELEEFQTAVGKPLLFTEVGYRSANFAGQQPWAWGRSRPYDGELQARCYQALFEVWWRRRRLHGVFFWHWATDPHAGGSRDDGFTPQRKPAEAVLTRWYDGRSRGLTKR